MVETYVIIASLYSAAGGKIMPCKSVVARGCSALLGRSRRSAAHSAVALSAILACAGPAFCQSTTASSEAAAVVERGRYLAAAGNCVSCHTVEGQQPFSGGVLFETPFGSIYSTNITSDPTAGIGAWSKEQFQRAMREGVRADGEHLYPVFPFPAFTRVGTADIDAIWAYLKTIPASAAKPPPDELSFPFSQRGLMGLWKVMFFKAERYKKDAAKSSEWNRGAYLVQGLLHCGACHTPRNALGAEKDRLFLAGASYMDHVSVDERRQWSAVNLTPSPNGLGSWSADDIGLYLKTGHNARAAAFGPMLEVIKSTRQLTDSDIRSIAAYLKEIPAQGDAAEKPSEQQVAAGEIAYNIHCGTCHLPTGLGDKDTGPPLVSNPIVLSTDPSSLINVILYGARLLEGTAAPHSWKSMEPLGDRLSDREVADISNFIRGSWGNAAPAVETSEVAKQR